ncbi:MAG TPA: SET domain-containing protein-lysine N-methyltransferase [Stellaceae bacterium]|nr:SET domain-containing protein-lysine N-methyltransferase [Stellaceae bacterium]
MAAAAALRHGRGKIGIAIHPEKGRCLVATEPIARGELIEAAPVIILTAADCAVLDRTTLAQYYFHWDGDADADGRGAIALGYVGLCNHSARPRAEARRNFRDATIDLVALDEIAAGEEVTIDYNCPLWFEVRE